MIFPLNRFLLNFRLVLVALAMVSSFSWSYGQTYNDGPIQLQVKLRDINTTFASTDEGAFGVGFIPDELTYNIWFRDNANVSGLGWVGGACLQDDFSPPMQSVDFNSLIFNYTYPSTLVPRYFDVRLRAWEDDSNSGTNDQVFTVGCSPGGRCTYEASYPCCGVYVFGFCVGSTSESDDMYCDANPFKLNMDYRLGPPCQWYDHGYVIGSGCGNNNYQPKINSYWRYMKGTACNNAIDLGNVYPGFAPISHFNSNECYSDNYSGSPGNDVFYSVNVTSAIGLRASLCAAASFDTYIYVLDANCNIVYASNNDLCLLTSEVSVPLCNPGVYTIVVDGNAASDMGTFTLTVSENSSVIVNADAGNNVATCFGNPIAIGGSPPAVGGQPPYTYAWTEIGGGITSISIPTDSITFVFPSVTTQYVLAVTDGNNCVDRDTVIVVVNQVPL